MSKREIEASPVSVIALLGRAAVGKSTLAGALAAVTGWQHLSIDAERQAGGDWETFSAKVVGLRAPAITESNAFPIVYARALQRQRSVAVNVVCDESVRRQRIIARDGCVRPSRWYQRGGIPTVDTTNGVTQQLVADVLALLDSPL